MLTGKEICAIAEALGITAYTGVPDSTLSNFTDVLIADPEQSRKHFIAHNEGGAVAFACGHYLATGSPAMVYLQNSGIGNAVNPIASLACQDIYELPVFYLIGWRGEPGVKDEPQHMFQGKKTLEMLEMLEIPYIIVDPNTSFEDLKVQVLVRFKSALESGQSAALIIKKGSISKSVFHMPESCYPLSREDAIKKVLDAADRTDAIISTTGKTSREVFEYREATQAGHAQDFLTVGSMGHASAIALGIALNQPERTIWVLDGDGAVIMHMGAMSMVGTYKPSNYIHVVINNEMYESVGVMPTASRTMNFEALARANGYVGYFSAVNAQELEVVLKKAKVSRGPVLLEIKTNHLSRKDLGRPTTTPKENRDAFIACLRKNR